MKKILSLIMVAVVALGLALPMAAEGREYEISEWGITVTLPEGFDVIDEDTPEDHPQFESYGMTRDEYLYMLEMSDICFEMATPDGETEIYMQVWEESGCDFGQLPYEEIREYVKAYMYSDYADSEYGMMDCGFTKYIFVETDNEEWKTLEFITVHSGRMVWITMDNYAQDGSLEGIRETLEAFAKSLKFGDYVAPEENMDRLLPLVENVEQAAVALLAVIGSVLLLIIIAIVIIAVCVNKKKKPAASARPAVGTGYAPSEYKYCAHCGTRLAGYCRYCTNCGKEQS